MDEDEDEDGGDQVRRHNLLLSSGFPGSLSRHARPRIWSGKAPRERTFTKPEEAMMAHQIGVVAAAVAAASGANSLAPSEDERGRSPPLGRTGDCESERRGGGGGRRRNNDM